MALGVPNSVVHLELRTGNLACACAFYTEFLGWRAERVSLGAREYMTLALGDRMEAGVVEHEPECAYWLPYVQVPEIADATDRARLLGASVRLSPREGPTGWRSVLTPPAGGMLALWQPKG